MKFFFLKLIFFFLFMGLAEANENIRFININYIINNSEVGKNLNKLIEDKNKKINIELNKISEKLEKDKNKIVKQRNVLKKEEFDELAKNFDDKVKKFNQTKKIRSEEFNQFRLNSKKKNYWYIKSNNYKFFKKRVYTNFTSKRQNNIWRWKTWYYRGNIRYI